MPNLRGPIRQYPLRPVNEPAMYVMGEKVGQKVMLPSQRQGQPSGAMPNMPGMGVGMGGMGMAGMGGGMQHQAAMLAHQNREMEALERRQARERAGGMPGHGVSVRISLYFSHVALCVCFMLLYFMGLERLATLLTRIPSHDTATTSSS